LCYKVLTNNPQINDVNNGDGALNIFSWRPSLKRIEIQKLRMPYELWDDEYTIELEINKIGYYAVVIKNVKNGIKGFCHHIGINHHIPETYNNNKIFGRKYFPDKIGIRIKDI